MSNEIPCYNRAHGVKSHIAGSTAAAECAATPVGGGTKSLIPTAPTSATVLKADIIADQAPKSLTPVSWGSFEDYYHDGFESDPDDPEVVSRFVIYSNAEGEQRMAISGPDTRRVVRWPYPEPPQSVNDLKDPDLGAGSGTSSDPAPKIDLNDSEITEDEEILLNLAEMITDEEN